jgi:polysaccharide export outer membrane protein
MRTRLRVPLPFGFALLILILAATTTVAWAQSSLAADGGTPSEGVKSGTLSGVVSSVNALPAANNFDMTRSTNAPSAGPVFLGTTAPHALRIGPGDLVELRVFGVPELSEAERINDAGTISLGLIGEAMIAGLTVTEAEHLIEQRYRDGDFLKDPRVTLTIREYASQGVSVLGEISRPGVYPVLGTRRLYDILSIAGGPTPRAGRTATITHRDRPQDPVTVRISNDPSASLAGNIEVEPGDTIIISKAGVVYVVGAVARPAGFIMDNNGEMTVLQALAMAGGSGPSAALDKARIIRKSPSGVTEIPVPLKQILATKAHDVPLTSDDVLFVPGSAAKSVARRSAESVLQVATGLAIYRP